MRQIDLKVENQGLTELQSESIKVQLNMTLFDDVTAQLGDSNLDVNCSKYHCKFSLQGLGPQANQTLKLVFNLASGVSREDFEEIVIEYWPNEDLDPEGASPHITKLEIKLS